jgi:hypothetical protein
MIPYVTSVLSVDKFADKFDSSTVNLFLYRSGSKPGDYLSLEK